jgi:outer membrane lipoprotein SlyB
MDIIKKKKEDEAKKQIFTDLSTQQTPATFNHQDPSKPLTQPSTRTLAELEARQMAFFKAKTPEDTRRFEEEIGTPRAEQRRFQEKEQARKESLVSKFSAEEQRTNQEIEESAIDKEQVWAQLRDPANLQNIAVAGGAGGFLGSKIGAAVGTAVPIPVVGTITGATAGGIIGGVAGVALATWKVIDNNIKSQRTDQIKAQLSVNRDAITWKNQLASLANVDPNNAEVYLTAWEELDAKQRQAWAQLHLDARSNLNLRLGEDATRELQRFENYYQTGGGYFVQKSKMQMAIASPDFTNGVYGLMMAQQNTGSEE